MTHKATCIAHCKEFLKNMQCLQYYNTKDFEHIYRKFNGAVGNAFSIGIDAADFIIIHAKPLQDEGRNES